MHVILTHEQADFDAVASLWAASLLEPEALPVLPRRINRNVRGYLTLYGGTSSLAFLRSDLLVKAHAQQLHFHLFELGTFWR